MELVLRKQPQKYLASVDANTRRKLYLALDGLKELEGDIVKLSGKQNLYRLKIEHYRIIFEYSGGEIIIVETIDTRTNIKYRRY
ncbi:MAG: addiction module toxin RelE [Oscillospiraceae bacterium]|nr:addiction module toxin RelE [Oscillospiraceae bacterium]